MVSRIRVVLGMRRRVIRIYGRRRRGGEDSAMEDDSGMAAARQGAECTISQSWPTSSRVRLLS